MVLRLPVRWVLPAVAALSLALGVQAQTKPAPRPPHERRHAERDQIEALENQFQTAQRTGDTATMDKLLSDDYLGINPSGVVVTKAQLLDHMKSRKVVINTLVTSDQKIKLIGPIAIVTCLAEVDAMNDALPVHGKFRYTRVYQHLPDGSWKVTSFEATRLANQSAVEPSAAPPATAPKG
jgi:ketosteroid isomerase-like protein